MVLYGILAQQNKTKKIMSEFKRFKEAVRAKFQSFVDENEALYLTGAPKDGMWDHYLGSFPEGTNNIYQERREYDCNCCKQFVRPFGNVVAIVDYKIVSIWDIEVEGYYQVVADAMSKFVKTWPIENVFISKEAKLGSDFTRQLLPSGDVKRWEHFSFELPKHRVNRNPKSVEALMAHHRDNKNVFLRSVSEVTIEATETVLDLIQQGSLYRGDEFKKWVEDLELAQSLFSHVPDEERNNWAWVESWNSPVGRIRNSAIGTLLKDLSADVEIDLAVRKYEKVTAPTNYKRPKAIFTKRMIEQAENKINELGLNDSLARRHGVTEDITVNNVLFANRDAKKKMNATVFDDLKEDVSVSPKNFDKVEEVSIEDFIKNILPTTTSIELMMEGKHQSNLVSLIAPENREAKSILKWNNNFSWAYNGDITDSMKQNVKNAGGNVDGVMRFSIQWNDGDNNQNDFDAHCIEPNRNHIQYPNKGQVHLSSGMLDVDIVDPMDKVAVENIVWTDIDRMQEGMYMMFVHNYSHNGGRTGFTAEIEFQGQIYSYSYDKELRNQESVMVAKLNFSREKGIQFIESLEHKEGSREVWGVNTNKFTKVELMMHSPNYWDEQQGQGNKHYMFMLDGCKNESSPRGFFNEFLSNDLMDHRKVFEALGAKMRVSPSENQLSGLGFSSTQRNSVVARIEGNFRRTIKIKF